MESKAKMFTPIDDLYKLLLYIYVLLCIIKINYFNCIIINIIKNVTQGH